MREYHLCASLHAFVSTHISDRATPDSAEYNTGGTIVVNGMSIKVPQNLQFQFPAAFVPFKTVAAGGFLGNEVSVSHCSFCDSRLSDTT
jgi:hypothetical protein